MLSRIPNKKNQAASSLAMTPVNTTKYSKPKILLLDLPKYATERLRSKGFNVSEGTLGRPYRVQKSTNYEPLIVNAHVPNHTEQEIIVIDLAYEKMDDGPHDEKYVPNGETDICRRGKCSQGFLDPRVGKCVDIQPAFDRIYENGGLFILFADTKINMELCLASDPWHGSFGALSFPQSIYDFLPGLRYCFRIENDTGEEMSVVDWLQNDPISRLLKGHLSDAKFTCIFPDSLEEWRTLAENKYKQPVSIIKNDGQILIFPQICDKTGFLEGLFVDVLPEMHPDLFPNNTQGKWVHDIDYELREIIEMERQKKKVEQKAKLDIAEIEEKIEKERQINGWIYDLLTGTDARLVDAVRKTLENLGFSIVRDIDEERDRAGQMRREDLQIQEEGVPLLVIDIKGIGGLPSDDDVLQADKHATLKMRELKSTDVLGFSIINHQRHLPPLERNNESPFRKELLDVAEERKFGLMTCWDLYRLHRNFVKNKWKPENVKPLFYKQGRSPIVPKHYWLVGKIEAVWSEAQAFSVIVGAGSGIRIGDRLAMEFPVEFEEFPVESIQLDGKSVQHAEAGNVAGVRWPFENGKIPKGSNVYRVDCAHPPRAVTCDKEG